MKFEMISFKMDYHRAALKDYFADNPLFCQIVQLCKKWGKRRQTKLVKGSIYSTKATPKSLY